MVNAIKSGGAMCSIRNYKCIKEVFGENNVDILSLTPFNISGKNRIYTIFSRISNIIRLQMNGLSPKLENEIIDKIKNEKYTVVFIDSSLNGILIKKIKNETTACVISFFHNCEYSLISQGIFHGELEGLVRLIPAYINERLTMKYSDVKLSVNNRDKQLLQKKYHQEITDLLPISIDDMTEALSVHNPSYPIKLLFVGSNFFPNINGANWFIKNVLPYCNAELTFIGRDIDKAKISPSEKLKIIPNPDNLEPYYNDADLVVVPIFEGSGMKVKVAEALMYGKNILAADEAMNGYENLSSVIKCSKAEDFIDHINQFKAQSFNPISRETFLKSYSNESAIYRLKSILNHLL